MNFIKHIFIILLLSISQSCFAVRPFITDDARVVGYRLAQWETWTRFDKYSGQWWHMAAYGPHKRLELSAGLVFGYDKPKDANTHFSYAMPLLQGKYLIKEYAPGKGPGFGIVGGSFIPQGRGEFVPQGYGAFSFFTISQCFGEGEKILLHANIGGNYLYVNNKNNFVNTWGFGTQIKAYKGMHYVGEVFSGDPYIPGAGLSWQTGFRHFISDLIQIDGTVGQGIAGANPLPFWFSFGARFVTTAFEKKKKERLN
jgi:hypothetical protein